MDKKKTKDKKSDKYYRNMDHITYNVVPAAKYDAAVSGMGMIRIPEEIFGPKVSKTKTIKEIRG